MAAARISRTERLRAQRRGFEEFIEEERQRLERGKCSESEYVRGLIRETEEKIEDIDKELGDGEDHHDQVLDEATEQHYDKPCFQDPEDPEFASFAKYWGTLGARTECRVVQDIASVGLTQAEIFDVAEEYDDLLEEVWETFGVTDTATRRNEEADREEEDEDEEETQEDD